MTAAEQQKRWGICVESAGDGDVLIQIGAATVFLAPEDARRFCFELAGAYYQAERELEVAR